VPLTERDNEIAEAWWAQHPDQRPEKKEKVA